MHFILHNNVRLFMKLHLTVFSEFFFLKFCYVTQTTRQLLHEGAIQMNLPTNFEFKKYILDQDTPLAYRILLDKSNMYLEVCLQSSS